MILKLNKVIISKASPDQRGIANDTLCCKYKENNSPKFATVRADMYHLVIETDKPSLNKKKKKVVNRQ